MKNSDLPAAHNTIHTSTEKITKAKETVPECEDAAKLETAEKTASIRACEDDTKILAETAKEAASIQVCEDDTKLLAETAEETASIEACEDDTKLLAEMTEETASIGVCENDAKLLAKTAEETASIKLCEDDAKLLDETAEKITCIRVCEDDAKLLAETVEETASIKVCEDDAKLLAENSFEDKSTRLSFIEKVLAIKFMQLVEVVIIMTVFVMDNHNYGNIWSFVYDNRFIFVILSLAYVMIFAGLLIYCAKVRTSNPYRYILLVAYPLSYTLIICFALTLVAKLEFFAAWYYYCLTLLVLLVYSIFVCQTKLEFNIKHAMVVSPVVLTVLFAVCYPFYPSPGHPRIFYMLYPTIAVAFDLIFLLFNLEKMTTKNYRIAITPADFVQAAMNLHTDYYYTFVHPIVYPIALFVKNAFENPSHSTSMRQESN